MVIEDLLTTIIQRSSINIAKINIKAIEGILIITYKEISIKT
jgi:hypothetical protein